MHMSGSVLKVVLLVCEGKVMNRNSIGYNLQPYHKTALKSTLCARIQEIFRFAPCSLISGQNVCNFLAFAPIVAIRLKTRVYDCVGFYCHLNNASLQTLKDSQIIPNRLALP